MEDFSYKKKNIAFSSITGEVFSCEKRGDTVVHGSGGGGFVGPRGGVIQGTQISSSVQVTLDIWIRTDDGREEPITIRGDVPLLVGHRITLLTSNLKGDDTTTKQVALLNHAMGKWWYINRPGWLIDEYDFFPFFDTFLKPLSWLTALIWLMMALSLYEYFTSMSVDLDQLLAGGVIPIFLTTIIIRYLKKDMRLRTKITSHVKSIIDSLFSAEKVAA